jgi:anti-anti-sigma factor
MAPQEALSTFPEQGIAADFPEAGIAVVTLFGEHDLTSKQRLTEAIARASVRTGVLVDLSPCTFIDSTVIGLLFLARGQHAERGGRLELVIPPSAATVARVAELTLLGELVPIHDDRDTAILSLHARA